MDVKNICHTCLAPGSIRSLTKIDPETKKNCAEVLDVHCDDDSIVCVGCFVFSKTAIQFIRNAKVSVALIRQATAIKRANLISLKPVSGSSVKNYGLKMGFDGCGPELKPKVEVVDNDGEPKCSENLNDEEYESLDESEPEKIQCIESGCTKIFFDESCMKLHYRRSHNVVQTSSMTKKSFSRFCNCCNKTTSAILKDHYKTAHPELTEEEIRKLVTHCHLCKKTYAGASSLTFHKKHKHRELFKDLPEEDTKCNVCNVRFTTIYILDEHKRRAHPELSLNHRKKKERRGTTYLCNLCDKFFESRSMLTSHQNTSHKELTNEQKQTLLHECSKCSKKYETTGLSAHKKHAHPEMFNINEVYKALNKTRGLFLRWQNLGDAGGGGQTAETDWTTTELRNSLRSIEWDLEDLEDTITIVEKNPQKFKLDNRELINRRDELVKFRNEINGMKERLNYKRDIDITAHQPLLDASPKVVVANHNNSLLSHHTPSGIQLISSAAAAKMAARHSGAKYSKLENAPDFSPDHYVDNSANRFLTEQYSIQGHMMREQDEQLDVISDTVSTLKTVSRQIGSEMDEQAVMLDEFGNELDQTDTRLDSTMKRVAKLLNLNNDRNQWTAIIVLSLLLIVIIILFVVL